MQILRICFDSIGIVRDRTALLTTDNTPLDYGEFL